MDVERAIAVITVAWNICCVVWSNTLMVMWLVGMTVGLMLQDAQWSPTRRYGRYGRHGLYECSTKRQSQQRTWHVVQNPGDVVCVAEVIFPTVY